MLVVFCLLPFMEHYRGPSNKDVPIWRGQPAPEGWTKTKQGDKVYLGDCFNFLPIMDKTGLLFCLGHVQAPIRLGGDLAPGKQEDNFTVIWCTNNPARKKCEVVGWYEKARVHGSSERIANRLPRGVANPFGSYHSRHHKTYNIDALASDCRLINLAKRPRLSARALGTSNWSFTSKVWYGESWRGRDSFVQKLLAGRHASAPDVAANVARNAEDLRKRLLRKAIIREGQPAFRRQMLRTWGGRCAITGCGVEAALEACHIDPYLGARSNTAGNGLLLRADIHRLFDRDLLRVGPDLTVDLADGLLAGPYATLKGQRLRSPVPGMAGPDTDRLRSRLWHGAGA